MDIIYIYGYYITAMKQCYMLLFITPKCAFILELYIQI